MKENVGLPSLPASHISSSDDDYNGWRVGFALIYLWHFYCVMCACDEWAAEPNHAAPERNTFDNLSRKIYLYILFMFIKHPTIQPSNRPNATWNNEPFPANATRYCKQSLWRSRPFNTQECGALQISRVFCQPLWPVRCICFFPSSAGTLIFLASFTLIEPRKPH